MERFRRVAGQTGDFKDGVLKVNIPRNDLSITAGREDLKLMEIGAPIDARMGLNTWVAFVDTNENAGSPVTSPGWRRRSPRS